MQLGKRLTVLDDQRPRRRKLRGMRPSGLRAIPSTLGTITNSKNIKTFLWGDPVRVSGGLIASYTLVDANDGAVITAGTIVCQTTQAKLRNIQSGNWNTFDASGKAKAKAEAFCQ